MALATTSIDIIDIWTIEEKNWLKPILRYCDFIVEPSPVICSLALKYIKSNISLQNFSVRRAQSMPTLIFSFFVLWTFLTSCHSNQLSRWHIANKCIKRWNYWIIFDSFLSRACLFFILILCWCGLYLYTQISSLMRTSIYKWSCGIILSLF